MHPHHRRSLVTSLAKLALIVAAVGLGWYSYATHIRLPQLVAMTGTATATVEFEVARGEGVRSIATRLAEEKVISNADVFVTYLDRAGLIPKIQAGHFSFAPGLTMAEVAERLQRGGATEVRVTILEGWDSSEMDARLVELGLIQPGQFSSFVRTPPADFTVPAFATLRPTVSLEGYLFPATYAVNPATFTIRDLASKMLTAMDDNLADAGWQPTDSRRPLHDILMMASIVELEERDSSNQPLVADILWRRLDDGWQLGADATLFYAVGHKEFLTASDLAVDSPYNTRNRTGLPPTPVASPGLSAIRAAVSPEANDFWFYLHDTSTGEIHFAVDAAGHAANKAKYIK